jgi:glycosyltransferase involved in cell wall biosynthesis
LIPPEGNPLVSAVIPVYNGEAFVAECLESVFRQTYRPIEVICVDDGSTDRSVDIVRGFGTGVTLLQQANRDVSAARNAGTRNASGEFVAFLDHDDWWEPDKTAKQVRVFLDHPDTDLVFTDLVKWYAAGRIRRPRDRHRAAASLTAGNLFAKLLRKNVLMPSAVMVRRESFLRSGGFDESFKTCGDYELWLRMAAAGMRFRYLPEPLLRYRHHASNTARNTELMHADRIRAVELVFADPRLPKALQRFRNRGMAAALLEGAHAFYGAGNRPAFLENAARALRLDPFSADFKTVRRVVRSLWYRRKRAG